MEKRLLFGMTDNMKNRDLICGSSAITLNSIVYKAINPDQRFLNKFIENDWHFKVPL
jgi:hypothetical protein